MVMYLTIALGVLVLILAFACRRLWIATQNTVMRDWAFSLEMQLKETRQHLCEQDAVLLQIAELFDSAGVALERTVPNQAAEDLKRLGAKLRSLNRQTESTFDLTLDQEALAELGNRYGIEPVSGGPHNIRNLVRIAEEVLVRVLERRVTT